MLMVDIFIDHHNSYRYEDGPIIVFILSSSAVQCRFFDAESAIARSTVII